MSKLSPEEIKILQERALAFKNKSNESYFPVTPEGNQQEVTNNQLSTTDNTARYRDIRENLNTFAYPARTPVGDILEEAGRSKYDLGTPAAAFETPQGIEDWRGDQQTRLDKLFNGIAVRLPATTYTKLMEGLGYAMSLPLWAATGDISYMTENAFSGLFAMAEEAVKEAAPIYAPKHVREGNLLSNMTSMSFWMNEGIDAAAFLAGFAVLGYATSGLSPILNAVAKGVGFGAKAGKAAKAMQLGVATYLQTASEAGFEAAHFGKEFDYKIKSELDKLQNSLTAQGRPPEYIEQALHIKERQLQEEKAKAQADIFKTNVGILLGPNLLMNRFLFGKMFNTKAGLLSKIYDAEASTVKHLSRKELAKDIAQKAGLGVLSEGFWEEGMQETATRYFEKVALGETDLGFVRGMYDTYVESLGDVNFQKAIFLGGVLGSLGGGFSAVRENIAANKMAAQFSNVLSRNPNGVLSELFTENEGLKSKDPKVFSKAVKDVFKKIETLSTIVKRDAMADVFTALENQDMKELVADNGLLSWAYKLLNVEDGLGVLNSQIDKITEDAYNEYVQKQEGTKTKADFAQFKTELKTKVAKLQKITDTVNTRYSELANGISNNTELSDQEFDMVKKIYVNSIKFAQINTLANIDFLKNLRNKKIAEANTILATNLVTDIDQLKSLADVTKADIDVVESLTKQIEEINDLVKSLNKDFDLLTNEKAIENFLTEIAKAEEQVEKDLQEALNNPQNTPKDVKETVPEATEEILQTKRAEAIENFTIQKQELDTQLKAKEITKEEYDKQLNNLNDVLERTMTELESRKVKDDAQESKKSPKAKASPTSKDSALEEDYNGTTESETAQETRNRNPRQPFVGVYSFFRTTNAQHKIIEFIEEDNSNAPLYEPIVRFQQFIDKWTPKSKETLVAYTWGAFKQKFADKLPQNLISILEASGQYRDDYTVMLVLSDANGNAIEVKSHFDKDVKTIQFSFLSDLTDVNGNIPYNQRTSGAELVDMKKVENPEEAYKAAAEEFENTVRKAIVDATEGLKLKITGKTSGLVQVQSEQRPFTTEEAKKTNILIPIDNVLTNEVTGETREVKPGFVYAEVDGTIISLDRVRLRKQDRDNIIGVLQHLMLNPTLDNYNRAFELINTYAYMVHETDGRSNKFKNKQQSKFYVETSGAGTSTNYTAVVFGDQKITKEQLLSGDVSALEAFLADKFYNVDKKRLESGNYKTIETATPTFNEEGNITSVELKTKTNRSGYKNKFLLDPNSPKVETRMKQQPAVDTLDGYTQPKAVNRSLRFVPAVPIAPEASNKEDSKVEETSKSGKFTLSAKDIKSVQKGTPAEFKDAEKGVPTDKTVPRTKPEGQPKAQVPRGPAKKAQVTPKPKTKPAEVKKSEEEFNNQASKELNEAIAKKVEETTKAKTPATKEVKKSENTEAKNLSKKIEDEGENLGDFTFMTKNSDSPKVRGTHGLFQEYVAFKKVFPNVQISITGLRALRERDASLSTIDGIVRVMLNPAAANGSLWHEGFHIKNLLFNTKNERVALYNALREELGSRKITFEVFEEKDGLSIPVKKTFIGKELSDEMAEEYLAEQFRSYMLLGKDNYKFSANESLKKRIFEKLWNAILDAFEWLTGRTVNREEAASNPEWLITEFESITNGVFDANTLTILPRVSVNKIGNIPEGTSKVMVNGLNSIFFKIAFDLLDGATVLQDINAYFPSIYKTAKAAIQSKIDKGLGTPVMELIIENWEDVVYEHYKFLRQYKIDTSNFEEATQDADRGRSNDNWFDSNTVDVRSNMQTAVKLLIASINQYAADGSVVYEGGLPQSAPYMRVLNRIQYDLANAKDFDHMVEIMQAQSAKFPLYKELMTKLGVSPADVYPATASDFQVSLQAMFFEQFNKANVEMLSMVLGEGNNNYLTESVSTSMTNRITDVWKNNVKYRDPKTSGIFKLVNGRFKLDPNGELLIGNKIYKLSKLDEKKLNELNKDPNVDAYRDFIAAFGINLNPGVTAVNDMKNAANGILKAVSESVKDKTPLFVEDIFNRNRTTINKELNALAEYQAEFELDTVSGQYINEKGQTEHSIGLKNFIDRLLDSLNYSARTKTEIPRELQPFDPETGRGNFLTYGSRWLEAIEDGNLISRGILRAFGRERGEKVDFNNLKPADHLALQLEAILNGYVPYIRSADRKREYAFGLGRAKVMKIDQDTFREELEHYLEAELLAAIAYVNNPEFARFQRGKNDGKLNFFRDITPFLNSEIAQYEGLSETEYLSAAQEIISAHKDSITEALDNYIEDYRKRTLDLLVRNKIFQKFAGKQEFRSNVISEETLKRVKFTTTSYRNKDGEVTQIGITEESLNELVDTYNYYFTTSAIEQTKLITGNINTYASKESSELTKRTTLFTSTGSPMQDSAGFNNQLNSNPLNKRLDGREHSSKYNQITVKDVRVTSVYHKLYNFFIGDKAKAYTASKMKENDAAGGMFMDAYKAYHIRGKGWSELQDKTWQYEAQVLFKELLRLNQITKEEYAEMFSEHLPSDYSVSKFYYKGEEITVYTENEDGTFTYNLDQFSQKKPIAIGLIANEDLISFGKKATTKTALSLYLPSDYIGNDAAILWMWDAMQNGIDFVFPESAEKAERVGNIDGELPSFYKEDGSRTTITEMLDAGFIPTERFWKDMSDQLDIEPSGKEKATDSTQKRRLIYLNAFNLGEAVSEKQAITDSYNEYVALYNAITDQAIENLVKDLGLTGEGYALEDVGKFVKVLTDEFSRRELPDNAFEAIHMIFNVVQELKLFDALPNKRQFVNLLQGLVRARAVNLKVSGDMLIQQASTGMESANRNVEASNFLKFYRLVDKEGNELTPNEGETTEQLLERADSVAPAEAMISLPLKWIPYVSNFKGRTFEEKLENFNKAITDPTNEKLYAEFKKIRTYIANRIPGQDLNSIEALEVVKFLSPFGGPRVVLPTEIVAKAGSDYDVDKLTTYFNNVSIGGERKQPRYINYLTDRKQLWENYKQRKLNSKKAKELLEEIGVDLREITTVNNLGEALNRAIVEEKSNKKVSDAIALFETDSLSLILQELLEADIMVSEEEFMKRPIERMNSKAAVENRLNEINKSILLNKYNFAQLITPNSPGVVEQAANAMNPEQSKLTNHELLEVGYNNTVTHNQLSNKAGVGIAANNSSAHALQQIHPIRVKSKALQILFPEFEGTEELSLGHIYDAEGNLISENNASVLTAFVDAAGKIIPDTNRINLTTSTANTYSLLNRLGSEDKRPTGFRAIANLINSKIVRYYEDVVRVNDAEFVKNANMNLMKRELVSKILTSKSDSEFYAKELASVKEDDRVFLYEVMDDYIKTALSPKSSKSDIEAAEGAVVRKIEEIKKISNPHWKNLEMYLYYQEASKLLNMLQQVTRPDSGLQKNRVEVFLRQRKLKRLINSNIFDSEGIKKMISDSYIKGFSQAHAKSLDMFNQFFIDSVSEEFRGFIWDYIADFMDNPLINRNEEKSANAMIKITNATLNYILHTTKVGGKALNELYSKLAVGRNSLPKRLGRLKNELYNNPETYPVLANNPAILEFVPMIEEFNVARNHRHEVDYVKTFNRKYTVEESNAITNGIRELLEHSDPRINEIGRDLVDFAIIQSGVQVSPFSFFELLPADTYFPRMMSIINEYFNSTDFVLDETAKDYIFGNLVQDTNVVPRVRSGSGRTRNNNQILSLSSRSQNSNYEYISKYVYNKKRDEVELVLYKRVGFEQNGEFVIYRAINIYGDPNRFFEAYRNRRASLVKSNTKGTFVSDERVPMPKPKDFDTEVEGLVENIESPDKPKFIINKKLKNKDGSKRLASTDGTTIRINPVKNLKEFFDYFQGKNIGESSRQKKFVLIKLAELGYTLDRIREIIETIEDVNIFLALHEQDHIEHEDKAVYWTKGTDLLTTDKINIETRATYNALKGLEALKGMESTGTTPKTATPGTQLSMFQLSPETTLKSDAQLNNSLNKFLKALGVRVNNVEQITDSNNNIWGDVNSGAIAVSKIIQRTIDVIAGRADRVTLPEEAAHFYVELLDRNDILYKSMMKQIENYKLYEDTFNEYYDVYEGDIDKIKREAIAKVIGYKIAGEKLDLVEQDRQASNWLRALWSRVKGWFDFSKNPFAISAKEILDGEVSRLMTASAESQAPVEMFRAQGRLDMLDDVAAAQMAENKRREQAEEKAKLESTVPTQNETTSENNKEELKKVSERDLAIQDIFRNFDSYFPEYSHWTDVEKLSFAESMDMFEIMC